MTLPDALYPPLNLPAAPLRLRGSLSEGGRPEVYDPLRRRWVALTPEEWVRQHFTAWLVAAKGYFAGRMANEVALTLNGTSRRCDTVVFATDRSVEMIVEYKAPSVAVTQAVFDQIVRYNSVLRARYLVVSNGLSHFCCEMDYGAGSYRFLPDIPAAQALT